MKATLTICGSCGTLNRVALHEPREKTPVCGKCKSTLSLGVVDATATTLPKLIAKSDLPVVVDFWAPWCGPCRAFAPTFQNAAKEMAGQFVFAKLNTEEHAAPSQVHQIRSIPTLILFKQGKEIARQSGALSSQDLFQWLKKFQ